MTNIGQTFSLSISFFQSQGRGLNVNRIEKNLVENLIFHTAVAFGFFLNFTGKLTKFQKTLSL